MHYSGLPVAQNIYTKIFSKPNEYEFCANNMTFKLLKEKVTDVAITNDVEIQKSNVSSIGPLGSMIGGRSKEKTSNIVTSYLVFTYLDHDEIKYISFNCTNDFKAMKFVKEFKQNNQKINSDIDL